MSSYVPSRPLPSRPTPAGPEPGASAPAGRKPTQVTPPEIPGVNGLLTLAVGVVVVAALYFAREVLIPITLAVLLSFLLAPLVNLLERLRLGRVIPVVLAVLLAISFTLGVAGLIGTQVANLASDAPRYAATVEQKVETIRGMTLGRLAEITSGLGQQLKKATQQPPPAAGSAAPVRGVPAGTTPKPLPVEVQQPQPTPFDLASRLLTPVVAPLATIVIVVLFSIFILLQREDLRDRLIRLFGSGDLHRTTTAMNDAASRLSRYFLIQLAINASFGIIVGGGLMIIGVPSAPLWGVLAMLLRFVPYVGPWLAAVMPLGLAAAVDPGWSMLIWTAVLYGVTEFIMGQAVEPLLYGHSTGLSPVSVIVAATFWTWLWGPIGLILSTPITLCLVVLGRHVDRLEFLDVLLGDRPALTPPESFYQRMLAGDADEAHDQAEVLLRDRSLSAYYDEVAIRGLQLAANDALREVLTDVQLERIRTATNDLVGELDAHEDVNPQPGSDGNTPVVASSRAEQAVPNPPAPALPPEAQVELAPGWQGAAPVLVLAGRGPLDDAAAAILAQLLCKHGLTARVATHAAASRENIATLDLDGVAMVCVTYLEIAGTPSHLRYLLRRLHQRAPTARILVGLWGADDPMLRDDRLRATVGATDFVPSLREAVQVCLNVARPIPQPEVSAEPGVAEAA